MDVNVTARVMERATKGGLMLSNTALDLIPADELSALGLTVKRQRWPVFSPRPDGVPDDLVIYRVRLPRQIAVDEPDDQGVPGL